MDICLLLVLCAVGRGLCFGLITGPEKSYAVWNVWVWSSNVDNEEALAHYGVVAPWGKIILSVLYEYEDWKLSFWIKHRLRVFEKSVIILMEEKNTRFEKLHHEELHNLHYVSYILLSRNGVWGYGRIFPAQDNAQSLTHFTTEMNLPVPWRSGISVYLGYW
jgi:hypothetical protein